MRDELFVNKIICGDAVKIMETLPDKCIDLFITDPPCNSKNIGPNQRIYSKGQMQLPEKEYKKFCKDWFKEALRITKNNRIIFTPGIANTHCYPQPFWIICWHKPAAVSFNRMGGYNAWEPVFCYSGPAKGKRLGQDYIKVNTLNFNKGCEKEHPCPKVKNLWRWLIEMFSNENEIVADFFVGSGTTSLICEELNRRYICGDINPDYIKIANKRLLNIQPELFNPKTN